MVRSLTDSQRLAATLTNSSMALWASAGSGKTATLVERYLNLIKSGIRPRHILTVTFTKEASEQLKERILERMIESDIPLEVQTELINTHTIGTIHSLCYWILDTFGSELSLPAVEGILDEFELVGSFENEYQRWLDNLPDSQLGSLLERFTHKELREIVGSIYQNRYLFYNCFELCRHTQSHEPGKNTVELLASAVQPLIQSLSQRFQNKGFYSFDDLEHLSLKILTQSAITRSRLSSLFQSFLIDEFQDTSPTQWQILRILVGEELQKLFIVGDPKQSIYGFRQAEPILFEEVSQLIEAKAGSRVELLHNFRTHSTLLAALNSVSEPLFKDQPFFWNPMVSGINEADIPEDASFSLEYFGPQDKTNRQELHALEVNQVTQRIEALLKKGILPGTIALLFRNSDRIAEFRARFLERKIPTECTTTELLSQDRSTLELISYLRLLCDPTHDPSWVAFLRSSYVNWSFQDVLTLCQKRLLTEKTNEPLVLTLKRNHFDNFSWLFDLIHKGESNVFRCLDQLFAHTHAFPEKCEAFYSILRPLIAGKKSLFELYPLLESFSQGNYFFQKQERTSNEMSGVKLMTVHASKGLEFDHVFLVDTLRQIPQEMPPLLLKAGLPPGIRFWEGEKKQCSASYQGLLEEKRRKEDNEARRILYVALTRAKRSLRIFIPHPSAVRYPKESWAALVTQEQGDGQTELSESPRPTDLSTTL